MSISRIKNELQQLCIDVSNELPEDLNKRIVDLRKQMIHSPLWIDKNSHLRLKALECLWTANLPNKTFEQVRWQINKADGWMDEALRIDASERSRGTPKPLIVVRLTDEVIENWFEDNLAASNNSFISSQDLYDTYIKWTSQEEGPNPEVLTLDGFGKKLGAAGFERVTKKIAGKAVKGWRIEVVY